MLNLFKFDFSKTPLLKHPMHCSIKSVEEYMVKVAKVQYSTTYRGDAAAPVDFFFKSEAFQTVFYFNFQPVNVLKFHFKTQTQTSQVLRSFFFPLILTG